MKTKQKALSAEALKKVVAETFASNPEMDVLHVCADGSCFNEEKEAVEWAKRVEGEEFKTVSRNSLKKEIEHAEENPYDAKAEKDKREGKGAEYKKGKNAESKKGKGVESNDDPEKSNEDPK